MSIYCTICDSLLPSDAHFCSNCGNQVPATGATQRLTTEPLADSNSKESTDQPICPKCQHLMERGFIADYSNAYYTPSHPILFIERKPAYTDTGSLIDFEKRRKWIVRAYRCQACGFLEHYAKSRFDLDHRR